MSSSAIAGSSGKEVMPALTGLRFLLALLVMLFHESGKQMAHLPSWITSVVSHGYLAVNAFFILSGFVLAHSYLDDQGRLRGGLRNFRIARFARIYPVYALTIILSFPHRLEYSVHHPRGWGDALASGMVFALLQAWIPTFALLINSAAWSLSAEAFFYFCFPALSKLTRNRSRREVLFIILGCWTLCLIPPSISQLLWKFGGPNVAAVLSADWFSAFLQFNPLFHVPAFVMGIATQKLFLLERSGPLATPRSSARIATLSFGALWLVLAVGGEIPRIFFHNGLLGLAFAALIFGLAAGHGALARVLAHPFSLLLGEASYSLYLLHLPLRGFTNAVNSSTLRLSDSSWLFLLFEVAIAITVSILTLKYVERPYRISVSASLRRLGRPAEIAAVQTTP